MSASIEIATRQSPWTTYVHVHVYMQMWTVLENEALSEDENLSSSDSREDNVCNDALHVIGLYGPGDKVSLPWRLGAREGGVKLSHCLGYVEMHEAW